MITQERLKELFSYDQDTGVFIWRVSQTNRVMVGSVAGSLLNGYITLTADGDKYQAHRLAWLYVHGRFPDGELDHINRCRGDNRIANLRVASRSLNALNTVLRSTNTSGVKGVSWCKRDRRWMASFCNKPIGSSRLRAVADAMRFAAEIAHRGMRPTD